MTTTWPDAGVVAAVQAAIDRPTDDEPYTPPALRVADVVRATCIHFGYSQMEMTSGRRNRALVSARQVGMYVARTMTPKSHAQIGRYFGGRDHSTIIHGVRTVQEKIAAGDPIIDDIEAIRARLLP